MLSLNLPDAELTEKWLERAGMPYYICDHCHGLHLSDVQEREGVADARLFAEDQGLLLSIDLELRPSALLVIQADSPRMNMMYPSLKIFPEVSDDTLPRLVVCDLLLTSEGVTFEQFVAFVGITLESAMQLLEECRQQGVCGWPEEGEEGAPVSGVEALH